MPKLTDNSAPAEKFTSGDLRPGGNAMAHLLSYVERFERLTEEITAITEDRKELMAEVKGVGFDTKILRQVIARRRLDKADLQEHDAVLELYEEALREAEKAALRQSEKDGV